MDSLGLISHVDNLRAKEEVKGCNWHSKSIQVQEDWSQTRDELGVINIVPFFLKLSQCESAIFTVMRDTAFVEDSYPCYISTFILKDA